MFSIIFDWKPFRIHLPSMHALLLENAGVTKYCGMSADTKLTLHFQEEIVDEGILLDITDICEGVVEAEEAAKFKLDADRAAAVASAKAAIPSMDLLTSSPEERKLLMGIALTPAEEDTLVTKYLVA